MCYVCVGISAIASFAILKNPLMLIDVAIYLGLTAWNASRKQQKYVQFFCLFSVSLNVFSLLLSLALRQAGG